MEKTLFFEAFSTLDRTEMRDFGKFVQSPFFNKKAQAEALFDYYKTCSEQQTVPDPAAAFQGIYPDEPFSDQKLRLANSHLLALLEHFWAYQEKFKDTGRAKIRLAAAYRQRNLPKHFQITLREARSDRENQPYRHTEYYHDLNLIEWEQYKFLAADKRSGTFNLQAISDGMDVEFIARKLRLACFACSHQAVSKAAYDLGLMEPVLIAAQLPHLVEVPAIGLYYHCYCFLTDTDAETHFLQFKQKLLLHAGLFPEEERRGLYLLAINFGIKKINEMAQPYFQETFDLYKNALKTALLLENGHLSRFAFNNIVAIALHLGEVVWAETFIHEHKPFLERQYREAAVSLNLARTAYARKDYPSAVQNLQRADYKDLISNMSAKILLLKIYYETQELDLLDSHLGSLKNFIRRQTGIGYHRTNYSNIVQYTQLLLTLPPNDRAAAAKLRERIEKEPILTERAWFLGML